MTRYTSVTDTDLSEMLATIGVGSIEELFADIPEELRLNRPLALGPGLSEQEVYDELRSLAARSTSAEDEVSFLGAGMYDHYVPALIDSIIMRSEFLTPYTPYQPEISQGGLQAMFEYQTAISELTGLPVSNASVYEGPSAVGSAGYVAKLSNGRKRFVISRGVHPHSREVLATLAHGWGMEVIEAPLNAGATALPELGDDVSAVIVQQPNFLGAVEDLSSLAQAAKAAGALTICACDPLPLALLKTPGECGVDIAVGEGQTLGNRLDFGGPSFGFFAVTEALMRRHTRPDRGRDEGRRRQARLRAHAPDPRAAHPPREGDLEHLHRAGAERARRRDLPELARAPGDRRAGRADAAADRLRARPPAQDRRRQRAARAAGRARVRGRARRPGRAGDRALPRAGLNPGYPLVRDYPEHPNGLLVAITERRTRADIDRLAEVLASAIAAERPGVGANA